MKTKLTAYPFFDNLGKISVVEFECPGCGYGHPVTVVPQPDRDHWEWNGSLRQPTFSPSILVTLDEDRVCHSFVENGQIRFLPDSCHHLAGQTVPLVAYDRNEFQGCPKTVEELEAL